MTTSALPAKAPTGPGGPRHPAAAEPFVRARALAGFPEVVARNGGDPNALLRAFGIDPVQLNDPDNSLPGRAVARLLDHAARSLHAPDFGLQLSEHHDVSVLGTVALVMLNSDTVGEALQAVANNIHFHNPSARVAVTVDAASGLACYQHDPGLDSSSPRRQAIEFIYAIAVNFLRAVTNHDGADWAVHFRHARGLSARQYRQYFPGPMEFNRERDCILLPASLLGLRIDRADPKLRALALQYLRQLQRRYPVDLRRQVVELIRRQLPNGGGRIERVAEILGMHPKTLQRRLREEDATFQGLADEVRKSLAAEYLVFSFLPVAEVATLVGYSGQTAFIVACRRWFGVTPKVYRQGFLSRAARQKRAPAPTPGVVRSG